MSSPAPSAKPWCCSGYVSECPLCPEYGTSLLDPCPGHPTSDENQQAIDTARLHAERRHPGYEYATTRGPRKQWDNPQQPPCDGDGEPDPTWDPNPDAGRAGQGWDRFDYHEEAYWRRPKSQQTTEAADGGACHQVQVDGETITVRGTGDFTEQDTEFFAEIVRAAKRRYAAEHPALTVADPAAEWRRKAVRRALQISRLTGTIQAVNDLAHEQIPSPLPWSSGYMTALEDLRSVLREFGHLAPTPDRASTGLSDTARTGTLHALLTEAIGGAPYQELRQDEGQPMTITACVPDLVDAVLAAILPTTRLLGSLHRSAHDDVSRVIDLYERWIKAGPPPIGTPMSRWWDVRLVELHDAILPPEQQPGTDQTKEQ